MRSIKIKIIFSILLSAVIFNSAQLALAQSGVQESTLGFVTCGRHLGPEATPEDIKANECTIPRLLQMIVNIINFLLSWAWLVATLFIVWAGWGMINAGGNEEAISAAKTTLTNALIGFFLIMASFVLLNFIVSLVTGEGSFSTQKLLESFRLIM